MGRLFANGLFIVGNVGQADIENAGIAIGKIRVLICVYRATAVNPLKTLDFKSLSAQNGEILLTPRLVPYQRSAKAIVGVIHSVFKLGNRGLQSCSAFKKPL